jgi:head-tail adaptor
MNRARKYDKLIQLWKSTELDDGFGGYILSNALLTTFWANIETKSARILSDNGSVQNINQVVFTIRNREDIDIKDCYVKYKDKTYQIQTITTKDLNNIEIQIICNGG